MPNMANITVKKADGITDIIYTALTPSAGDQTPARWQVSTANAVSLFRPSYEMASRFNQKRDARNISTVLKYPDVRAVNGVDVVVGNCIINVSGVVPLQVTDTVIAEAIAQAANLFKATLVQDCFKAGYAAQ